ncbi:MAG TPA: hypothetical protein PLI65_05310 [Bacteroidales bacterium]|nr:hypothetical protein [Bacteroidales bacterium]
MNSLIEILKFSIPTLILAASAVISMKIYQKTEKEKSSARCRLAFSKAIMSVRLQACERILLFLERNKPTQVVTRLLAPQLSARELQHECITSIGNEFEHNFTQQLYVSAKVWNAASLAKESAIYLINKAFTELPENASAQDLALKIIEQGNTAADTNSIKAIEELKNELQQSC